MCQWGDAEEIQEGNGCFIWRKKKFLLLFLWLGSVIHLQAGHHTSSQADLVPTVSYPRAWSATTGAPQWWAGEERGVVLYHVSSRSHVKQELALVTWCALAALYFYLALWTKQTQLKVYNGNIYLWRNLKKLLADKKKKNERTVVLLINTSRTKLFLAHSINFLY